MPSANYLIFARRAYQQPLEWIGDLRFDVAPTPEALDQRAREQFGGESWVEMVAIPEAAIVRVIPME